MDENQNADPTGSNPDQPGQPEHSATPGGPRVDSSDMRDLGRLRRSTTDRHVAGVAGGIARHFDIDPLIVRIAFVVLTFFGGAGLILYGACWLFVPEDDESSAPFDLEPRTRGFVLIIAGVIAALSVIGDSFDSGPGVWGFFPAIVIAAIAWVVLTRRNRRRGLHYRPDQDMNNPYAAPYGTSGQGVGAQLAADAKADPAKYKDMGAWQVVGDPAKGYRWQRDPRKRGPKLFWIAIPLIALALGTLGVVDLAGAGVIDAAYPALALAIIAVLLLLGSFWGRAGGLILLGLLLVPITAATTAAGEIETDTLTYKPLTYAEIPEFGYRLGAGEMVIDLTAMDPKELDGRRLEVNMDFGRMEIIVPDDVDVEATSWIHGPGGYELFEIEGGGIGTEQTASHDGGLEAPTFTVDAENGFGEIVVQTASEAHDVNDERDED
ncbi:PspC domain-containing protein [Nocardioides cavernaquae]|nr:PspC domain-containing protein [Nocardioides cavernaquae]